jgi:RNA polymerase sigma factor (sigma-70 family)
MKLNPTTEKEEQNMLDIDTLNNLCHLTAQALYQVETKRLPALSEAEEHELVIRARAGDEQAKAELIVSCLRYVWNKSYEYFQVRRPAHTDQLDLAQIANLAMCQGFERALAKPNPAAYLRGIAKRAMSQYCTYSAPLIQKPTRTLAELKKIAMPVVTTSLDEPAYRDTPTMLLKIDILEVSMPPTESIDDEPSRTEVRTARWKLLHQAIQTLTPRQREMLIRGYGLYGHPAETNEQLGPTGERLKRYATEVLRRKLAPFLEQLTSPEVERE